MNLVHVLYKEFLPSYQSEIDVLHLRKSFLFSPFSYEITENTVMNLIKRHYIDGNDSYVHAIIGQCPQLGLQYLLPPVSPEILHILMKT